MLGNPSLFFQKCTCEATARARSDAAGTSAQLPPTNCGDQVRPPLILNYKLELQARVTSLITRSAGGSVAAPRAPHSASPRLHCHHWHRAADRVRTRVVESHLPG